MSKDKEIYLFLLQESSGVCWRLEMMKRGRDCRVEHKRQRWKQKSAAVVRGEDGKYRRRCDGEEEMEWCIRELR